MKITEFGLKILKAARCNVFGCDRPTKIDIGLRCGMPIGFHLDPHLCEKFDKEFHPLHDEGYVFKPEGEKRVYLTRRGQIYLRDHQDK